MGRGPETVLVHQIARAIKKEWPTAWVFKTHGNPFQSAGVPDLLVVVYGRLIGLEVKARRPGESEEHALGRVTLRQQATLAALRRAGAVAEVVLTPEESIAAVLKAF